ncbi:MAG: hypothetical protein WDN06_22040 [Asticcacaulis sp.]
MASLDQIRVEMAMDKTMLEPARLTARLLAGQGLKVYEYRIWLYCVTKESPVAVRRSACQRTAVRV